MKINMIMRYLKIEDLTREELEKVWCVFQDITKRLNIRNPDIGSQKEPIYVDLHKEKFGLQPGEVYSILQEFQRKRILKILKNKFPENLNPVPVKIINKKKFNSKYKETENRAKKEKLEKIQETEKFEITVRDREIWINDYLLSKPHAVGTNFEFFDYVRNQPANIKIEWNKIPDTVGYELMKKSIKGKRFVKILNDIGFKGEIKKAFFYKVGKSSLFYRGDKITKNDLEKAGIKIPVFIKELELAHTKNSPE